MTRTIQQLLKEAPRIRVRLHPDGNHWFRVDTGMVDYLLTLGPFEQLRVILWMKSVGSLRGGGRFNPLLKAIVDRVVVAKRMDLDYLTKQYGSIDAACEAAVETNKADLS